MPVGAFLLRLFGGAVKKSGAARAADTSPMAAAPSRDVNFRAARRSLYFATGSLPPRQALDMAADVGGP